MSKKHRTAVPDFSSQKGPTKTKPVAPGKSSAPVAAPRAKPQATSAKSGRRGG